MGLLYLYLIGNDKKNLVGSLACKYEGNTTSDFMLAPRRRLVDGQDVSKQPIGSHRFIWDTHAVPKRP